MQHKKTLRVLEGKYVRVDCPGGHTVAYAPDPLFENLANTWMNTKPLNATPIPNVYDHAGYLFGFKIPTKEGVRQSLLNTSVLQTKEPPAPSITNLKTGISIDVTYNTTTLNDRHIVVINCYKDGKLDRIEETINYHVYALLHHLRIGYAGDVEFKIEELN